MTRSAEAAPRWDGRTATKRLALPKAFQDRVVARGPTSAGRGAAAGHVLRMRRPFHNQ